MQMLLTSLIFANRFNSGYTKGGSMEKHTPSPEFLKIEISVTQLITRN